MKSTICLAIVMLFGTVMASDQPVIGGPCEGCEWVFIGMPGEFDAESRIAPADEPGEPMIIEGTVRGADGRPAAGIIVYAYHTDSQGIYPRAETRHGRLRGWAETGADGRYRFDTVRPAAYPGRDIPQHVHMHVIEPGVGTYYIDDIVFSDDPLLSAAHRRQMLRGRGGEGLVTPARDGDGTWRVRRDITLGKNVPGHPAAARHATDR